MFRLPRNRVNQYLLVFFHLIISSSLLGAENTSNKQMFDVEEQRVAQLDQVERLDKSQSRAISELERLLSQAKRYGVQSVSSAIRTSAQTLWSEAVDKMAGDELSDDRWLYWQRLMLRRTLKQSVIFQSLSPADQLAVLWELELVSRGRDDILFDDSADIKILITGFDPFFLDRNISQSNPSGAAALTMDNQMITFADKRASIQALVVPVRFADFDQGMIETLLKPYLKSVDMIATISMGRSDFDLERFPGLRRSAVASDNLNVLTGANKQSPMIPELNGIPFTGPEFVEFSLPVSAMQKAAGRFKINDNHNVTTLNGEREPESLAQLADEIAVSGAGGGYLSNEISYRSIRLRDQLNPTLPVGHIHTPRITAFSPEDTRDIIAQIKGMLEQSLTEIEQK